MRFFCLPDLGEGLHDAEIVDWHVRDGDEVAVDQLLLTVETAKAIVEIPSPVAGRIRHCFGKPGDVVAVGEPLVEFAGEDSGTVVGTLASVPTPAADRFRAAPAAGAVAGPAVIALAARLGVDLSTVSGSGPGGRLQARDVEDAALQQKSAAGKPARGEALRGMRRSMAIAMENAGRVVVPVSIFDEADIGDWPPHADISVRIARAIAAACIAEPALNAWYDGNTRRRELCPQVDLGIAVDTPDGLLVPVLRDIAGRDDASLRVGIDRLEADARARKIPPEELRGATITLSNFGVFAGRHATPVVVPPTVCIVAAGRIHEGARVIGGQVAARRLLPLSVTFDHRAVTGGEAARFLAALLAAL
ncbi:MAG: dihydrolipoamide acetyltransferase family protein [Pseudomonadota bacterium]